MSTSDATVPHPNLQNLRAHLQQIHEAITNFQPLFTRPPILDSSLELNADAEDSQWLQQEYVPGLKKLRESIKVDLDVLEKFLNDPASVNLPPLSTNAPYLIAVWNEVLCATHPIVSVFKTFPLNAAVEIPAHRKRGTPKSPGAKVDVVSDNGRRWVRVNTIKNSRMLAEFREIDSYLTGSEDDSDGDWEEGRPTLAQTEFDNSVLRMGRSLLEAAKANPIEGTTEIPRITLRLTRLDPYEKAENGGEDDPRLLKTIQCLRDMDIDVLLGERSDAELPAANPARVHSPLPALGPTSRINLDLSVLIALISDLTHAALPTTVEEAEKRFLPRPPQHHQEWKKKYKSALGKSKKGIAALVPESDVHDSDGGDGANDTAKHSRALTNQLLQEMGKSLLQEIHDRTSAMSDIAHLEFWTTPEARDRCLRIVSKIGGPQEKRRAFALLQVACPPSSQNPSLAEAEKLYWQDSRFPLRFIPLLPIHLYPSSTIPSLSLVPTLSAPEYLPPFFRSLGKTCKDILKQETMPHPRSLPDYLVNSENDVGEIQRATITKANPRLTAHTVQSMIWGSDLGWTSLTANRTSVKAILREMKIARIAGRLDGGEDKEDAHDGKAAIWIVDPRSLAEGMSSYTQSA